MGLKKSSRLFLFIISGYGLFSIQSCKNKSEAEAGAPVEVIIPGLDPIKLTKLLLLKVSDTLYKPKGIYDVRFEDTLKKFYIERDGNPVWCNYLRDSMFRIHLMQALFSTEPHGLQNKFYNGELIKKQLEAFDKIKEITSDNDYQFLTDLDYLISMSVVSVYKDLAFGRIDPHKFYKPFYDIPFLKAETFNIYSVLQNPMSFQDSITMRTHCSRRYRALQVIYSRYNEYIKTHTIQDYDTSQSINSDYNTSVVDQRLEMIWTALKDSTENNTINIQSDREGYIKKTRSLYGLPGIGVDSIFIDRICVPSNSITNHLLASLERERWFSVPDTGIFVLVNLNEFMVYMVGDSLKSMKVCVGKNKPLNYAERLKEYFKTKNYRARPIDTETPQIGSRISEVIINPTWTVPNSIIGKEMYAQIISNPNYLTRKGFEVVKDGKVVSPGSINWKAYKPYGVKVKIRQKAGASNSLGRLKFNFPNRHNIYLHDTPEKGKFNQNNRAVSHGCIRLNHPPDMAEFLLGLQGDSTLVDKFRLKMGLQPYDSALQIEDSLLRPIKETEIIRLKRTVPIFLDYRTIQIERNGGIRFLKDIYRKDETLARKLRE